MSTSPSLERWQSPLIEHCYRVADAVPVHTRRYRGLANADSGPTTSLGVRDARVTRTS